jgi:opacity protein-like surface antigen
MRMLGFIGAIGLVVGLAVPAFAEEPSASEFFADSQLSNVPAMTDTQLAAVEGMSYKGYHGYGPTDQSNTLFQLNLNDSFFVFFGEGSQVNTAEQLNEARGYGRTNQSNWADQANFNFGGGFVEQANSAFQSNSAR